MKRQSPPLLLLTRQENTTLDDYEPTLTLYGLSYPMADLPQVARDTLVSLRFVEERLRQLQGEMAVSQTAHVVYAKALKHDLDPTAAVPPS